MPTLIYTDKRGNQLRFTGDDIEHCHEQMLDFLDYNWELALLQPIAEVTSAAQAQDIAIEYSHDEKDGLGYGDLAERQAYFGALADKFPELRQEFEENAII